MKYVKQVKMHCTECWNCEFNYQCKDCAYNIEQIQADQRADDAERIPISDYKAYHRDWMRRKRERELYEEMRRAGVL